MAARIGHIYAAEILKSSEFRVVEGVRWGRLVSVPLFFEPLFVLLRAKKEAVAMNGMFILQQPLLLGKRETPYPSCDGFAGVGVGVDLVARVARGLPVKPYNCHDSHGVSSLMRVFAS